MNAQCFIGSEKYPDAGINQNYAIGKYSQAYGEIVSCFRHLAKDNFLQPYITQKDFITIQKIILVIIYMFLIFVIIKVLVLLNL